jgi:hypothetical protein
MGPKGLSLCSQEHMIGSSPGPIESDIHPIPLRFIWIEFINMKPVALEKNLFQLCD